MRFFNFRKDSAQQFNGSDNGTLKSDIDRPGQYIPEDIFVEKATPEKNFATETINTPLVTNNIELLYKFLDGNYEDKGYNDALLNPDAHHLTQNLEALKYELERIIKKVKTFYEDFIKEVNYHIDSRARSGMVDTVEELQMKKEIAESHMEKVIQLEVDCKNNTGDSQGIMISYTKGFKNGLAAISHHTILQRKF